MLVRRDSIYLSKERIKGLILIRLDAFFKFLCNVVNESHMTHFADLVCGVVAI